MTRLLILLLLVPAARADGDWLDRVVASLGHPDPRRRVLAQRDLMARTDLPWDRVVPQLDSPSLEVRRAIRHRIRLELRRGPRETRLDVLHQLEKVRAARGLLPVLASLARKADPDLAGRAMLAHMRIGNHRDFVADLAASRGTWVFLSEFDPERDAALRKTAELVEDLKLLGRAGQAGDVKEFLDLLAAASDDATRSLAERITGAQGDMLRVWVEIAAHHAILPATVGPVLAERIAKGGPGEAKAVAAALVAGDPLWGEAAAPVLEATLARLARDEPEVRAYLLLLVTRCGGDDPRVGPVLERAAARTDATGIVAAALRASMGAREETEAIERLRALEPVERLRALVPILELGTAEFIPLIRDRLLHGGTPERRVLFYELKRIRARRLLIPDLEGVMEGDNPWHAELAVQAAAHVDPLLESAPSRRVLLAGLRHELPRVRVRAIYACDDLWRFTPELLAALTRLANSEKGTVEEANALASFVANLGEKGRHGSGFLPLLAGIVRRGPTPFLAQSLKTARTLRYEALKSAVDIDPRSPDTRAACRAALKSDAVSLKLKALHGLMQVRDPTDGERAAVAAAKEDGDASVRAYAARLLRRGGWRTE